VFRGAARSREAEINQPAERQDRRCAR
jgi:hypothetical protein